MQPLPWTTNFLAFPADRLIPAGDSGGARIVTGPLPLTYAALEVRLTGPDGKPLPVISIRGLTKRYGSLTALNDLNLDVHRGETFGFLGLNGAEIVSVTTVLQRAGLINFDGVPEHILQAARERGQEPGQVAAPGSPSLHAGGPPGRAGNQHRRKNRKPDPAQSCVRPVHLSPPFHRTPRGVVSPLCRLISRFPDIR